MVFIEAAAFTRLVDQYLSPTEYLRLQVRLVQAPEAGDLIRGTGGFRKIRWADTRRGKGRRGGLRVIYYHFADDEQIWLLTIYGKDEADDLSADERSALKQAIEKELKSRGAKRKRRKK